MLELDSSTHTYSEDGIVYDSVTQILKKAGLISYEGISPAVMMAAAERGTLAHKACDYYDDNDLDFSSLDPLIEPYINAYARAKEELQFEVQHKELQFLEPTWKFAGTIDRVVVLPNYDCLWIVDIKTGIRKAATRLQTAAYAIGFRGTCPLPEMLSHGLKRAALELHKNGTYTFDVHDDPKDEAVFLSALSIVNWKKNNERCI